MIFLLLTGLVLLDDNLLLSHELTVFLLIVLFAISLAIYNSLGGVHVLDISLKLVLPLVLRIRS